ncbi:hydrogenase expression/formation protein HupK [Salipiger aestuarii]|uniref:Hydrogenase expression/formation protein HupK n=1 Tax=Salipiger aestuarii TaxID=568098 RepID=A0A327YKG6_9RHOB|nr:hypothetical protein [Salipiger aestuarii]EIE50147.1 hydrogenase expression/formation protein HupK [Citreicella sp. 357]KAA8609930.1 hydrogenase expression/formation protein HupK [Salipiger aestuarii]KAA8616242.1 hydrogenase expression/formation protein HupK [Salipiger aestuarii]KAB2543189.1 hydrogenase expression/formation protein HupK [Salipiger aestuarii]RAK21514.1 hypothetical protein ATI53_1004112 [Salipiger aestuarii]
MTLRAPACLMARPAPRLPVAQLVMGRPVNEVQMLLPRLFNLCRGAQATAVSVAIGEGCHRDAASAIAREILRDHLLKLYATWPKLVGLAPQPLPPDWDKGGRRLLAWLFGRAGEAPASVAAFDAFLARRDMPVAPVMARIRDAFAPGEAVTGRFPPVSSDLIWAKSDIENSVAARHLHHPVMQHLETAWGRGPLWRAAARLYDIEAMALGNIPAIQSGAAWAMVPAARGSYAIRIVVAQNRVADFARVTPTDALLAPGGILQRCLETLPAAKAGLGALLLDILDPCSPVALQQVHHA